MSVHQALLVFHMSVLLLGLLANNPILTYIDFRHLETHTFLLLLPISQSLNEAIFLDGVSPNPISKFTTTTEIHAGLRKLRMLSKGGRVAQNQILLLIIRGWCIY